METYGLERFGVRSPDQITLNESSAFLEHDIRATPGLLDLLRDDCTSFHIGQHMLNGVIRKLDRPVFLRICDGEIGQLLANLRCKGEHYMFFLFLKGCKIETAAMDPSAFLEAAGWEVLNASDHLLFDDAWSKAGRRWSKGPL